LAVLSAFSAAAAAAPSPDAAYQLSFDRPSLSISGVEPLAPNPISLAAAAPLATPVAAPFTVVPFTLPVAIPDVELLPKVYPWTAETKAWIIAGSAARARQTPISRLRSLASAAGQLLRENIHLSDADARTQADFFSSAERPATDEPAITALGDGPPVLLGRSIPRKQYEVIAAKRLARPRLLWVNRAYLREMGLTLPEKGLTPEMEEQLLHVLAYGIPGRGEPASAFVNETKLFYADRYGGYGIGWNLGSGRAASAGKIQIKGIGRTPLVLQFGEDHSNGLARLEEGMREAFWGEMNQELPHGGNRVIALIDRGTTSRSEKGPVEPNVMIVREDTVRPAHFLDLPGVRGRGFFARIVEWATGRAHLDFARRVAASLPVPDDKLGAPLAERISAGLRAYVDRVAEQHAAAFARRLFHGATSESNIELSGRFLDYGTETAIPGYGKLRLLDHVDPAGTINGFRKYLVGNVVGAIRGKIPKSIAKLVPNVYALLTRFNVSYYDALGREFVDLTGVPSEIAGPLAQTGEAAALGKLLPKVAVLGAEQVDGKYSVPERITRYDLSAILVRLAALRSTDEKAVEERLKTEITEADDAAVAQELAQAYARYMGLVVARAESRGIAPDDLWRDIEENAARRNRSLSGAYRWKMMDENFALIKEYMKNPDPAMIQDAIDAQIAASRRTTALSAPSEAGSLVH
jgi:hypothetical protein